MRQYKFLDEYLPSQPEFIKLVDDRTAIDEFGLMAFRSLMSQSLDDFVHDRNPSHQWFYDLIKTIYWWPLPEIVGEYFQDVQDFEKIFEETLSQLDMDDWFTIYAYYKINGKVGRFNT